MIKFKINPDIIYKIFEDEVHVLDYKTANIYTLNETASFIWKQLLKVATKKELVEKMKKEFDVSEKIIKKDIEEFLNEYLEKEFIIKVS
jgi:hypothetical protein